MQQKCAQVSNSFYVFNKYNSTYYIVPTHWKRLKSPVPINFWSDYVNPLTILQDYFSMWIPTQYFKSYFDFIISQSRTDLEIHFIHLNQNEILKAIIQLVNWMEWNEINFMKAFIGFFIIHFMQSNPFACWNKWFLFIRVSFSIIIVLLLFYQFFC